MNTYKLIAEKRKLTGRKIKKLRREGILPANIYGKDFKSLSVQLPTKDFLKVFDQAGETGIIDLTVGSASGGGESHPVLVHNLQIHPVTSKPLHVDFHKVSLTEKVKAVVPVVTVGEAPAVAQKIGLLLMPVAELEVEALPADLPENIQVDVKDLSAIGQEIKIKDLKISDKITLSADPELVLVKIGELVSEEAKKMMEEEKAQAQAAAAAAAPAAEAVPAEGEAPKEETKPASAQATAGKPAEEVKPTEARPESSEGKKPKEEKK